MKKLLSFSFLVILTTTSFCQAKKEVVAKQIGISPIPTTVTYPVNPAIRPKVQKVEPLRFKRVKLMESGIVVPVAFIEWAKTGDIIMIKTEEVTENKEQADTRPGRMLYIFPSTHFWEPALIAEKEDTVTGPSQDGAIIIKKIRKAIVL